MTAAHAHAHATSPPTLDLHAAAAGHDPGARPQAQQQLVSRTHPFTVRYVSPEGDRHEAVLTSRILDGPEQDRRDRLCAASAGSPWENLPPLSRSRIWAAITCAVQLVEPPSWLLTWMGQDEELLAVVYEEVEGHTLRYFRGDDGSGEGAARKPRVVIVPHGATPRPAAS